jgi:hypothetical protein
VADNGRKAGVERIQDFSGWEMRDYCLMRNALEEQGHRQGDSVHSKVKAQTLTDPVSEKHQTVC